MNKEELQGMSDDELNELAAVKVMGWKVERSKSWTLYIDSTGRQHEALLWNPTNNMNAALVLMDQFHYADLKKNHSGGWIAVIGSIAEYSLNAPRAITIVAILAKEG